MIVLTILGARPQFIKAAAVSRCFAECADVREIVVHTGQHYDANMSDVFFAELGLPEPAYHLGVGSGPHGRQTGRMLERIEEVLQAEQPDLVLVYGDTNSTLAGALAAAKLRIPVAHVEAGLRSFNRGMPEEINRVVTDHLSHWLFAPTETAVANLAREGIAGHRVILVGDVMYDLALRVADRLGTPDRWGLCPRSYILATIHRAENTDDADRLAAIMGGLGEIAAEIPVVMPIHPRTRAAWGDRPLPLGLRFLEPVSYLEMACLERHARLIATDSGGVQKEAFFYRVPCVTLRDETEWVELVESGWNRLVPPISASRIAAGIRLALASPSGREPPPGLYGGGRAAARIVEILRTERVQ